MNGDTSVDAEYSDFVEVDPTGRYGRYNEILGKGASKKVFRAFDEYEGIEVAWNQVKLYNLFQSPADLERLYSEILLLKTLKHNNIMKFYTSWVDTENRNINFVTEMFTSGTMRQYRLKHRRVNIRAVKHWCRQILKGLLYLHSHDPPVIHRDLKCDNIFINGNQGEVKIGDLGLAAILCKAHAASCVGTPEFMAPEVYNEEYNELVDIYSFGMCILEMVTFEYPYSECTHPAQIYKKVVSGQKPEALDKVKDPKVRQFVERCLATVSLRLSARELLTDPFLQIDDYNEVPPLVQQPLNGIHNSSISLMNGCTDHPGYGLDELDYHQVYSETSETALFDCPEDDHMAGVDITIKGRRGEDDDIFLRLRIADREGRVRNIYFPFDMENDTALSVAIEMVAELDIIDQDVTKIANMIDGEIANLVPEWKTEPGIEETPYCTSATFCQHCASNGSLFEYVSSNCPTANNFQVVHCATHGSAALHGRFEEITYQVEGSEQCATEGAPVASSQSNGAQYTDIWAQRDEHELSWEGLKDINCDDSHETLNQSIFNKDEKTIHMDDKSYPYSRNFPSNPVADCALLDYENDFRQELRWLKAKYQLQLRELRGLQLAVKPKYSSLAPNSDSSELEHRKDGGVSRQTVSTQLKMQDNKPHLKSSPSGRKFTSYSTDAEKLCTNVGNQKVHVVAVSGSYSPEPMVTAKDFYTGTLLPHSLNRATSLPVDAVDV